MSKATLKINLTTGIVKRKAEMSESRSGFSSSVIGHKIFIIGGYLGDLKTTPKTSVYDVIKNNWSDFKFELLGNRRGMQAVPVKKRFIFLFGG